MSLPNELALLGRQRLELIGKYAPQLIQSYVDGQIDESSLSAQILEKLVSARILTRPDEQGGLCLRPAINELIANLTQDERKRQINSDVGDHLDHIRTRVESIRGARNKGDYAGSEMHMQLLNERVQDMTGQFGDAIESLWYRLNSEFGFVSSLDDKIRETELAQKQLRRLLDGFSIIDFDEMIELAGHDSGLRRLLVNRLQVNMSQLSGSLLEVQKRLVDLMSRFREQAERALLVSRMAAFLRQHPNFQIGDYANRSIVPTIVNHANPIIASSAPSLDRSQDHIAMANIAASIEISKPLSIIQDTEHHSFSVSDMSVINNQRKQLALDVENFFIQVIESPQAMSALDYLQEQQLEWDCEGWLFQVIAEYESMPEYDKPSFQFKKSSRQFSEFNHLRLIDDVYVGTVFFNG